MSRVLITLFITVSTILPRACDFAFAITEDEKIIVLEQLEWLMSADPVRDVNAAAERGDYHFMGLMGYSLIVPGISEEAASKEYMAGYQVKAIPGTSDYFEIPEQKELARLGGKYARRYNELLLEKIGGKSYQELLRESVEKEYRR